MFNLTTNCNYKFEPNRVNTNIYNLLTVDLITNMLLIKETFEELPEKLPQLKIKRNNIATLLMGSSHHEHTISQETMIQLIKNYSYHFFEDFFNCN